MLWLYLSELIEGRNSYGPLFLTLLVFFFFIAGVPTEFEFDELHRRLAMAKRDGAGFAVIEALFQECCARPESDGECMLCGIILCPHHEPMHYHHDGCPACTEKRVRA
jgi:hypothetical protein